VKSKKTTSVFLDGAAGRFTSSSSGTGGNTGAHQEALLNIRHEQLPEGIVLLHFTITKSHKIKQKGQRGKEEKRDE